MQTSLIRDFVSSYAKGVPPVYSERYSGEGLAVIFDHVLPAYRSLRYFLSQVSDDGCPF